MDISSFGTRSLTDFTETLSELFHMQTIKVRFPKINCCYNVAITMRSFLVTTLTPCSRRQTLQPPNISDQRELKTQHQDLQIPRIWGVTAPYPLPLTDGCGQRGRGGGGWVGAVGGGRAGGGRGADGG